MTWFGEIREFTFYIIRKVSISVIYIRTIRKIFDYFLSLFRKVFFDFISLFSRVQRLIKAETLTL